ncbi:MAG: cupin domain-containing protein [Deltaproteobacteria bacterium]|nr:MAG: cupin domain-containing protein [Deltaproteobacteria bacterium]
MKIIHYSEAEPKRFDTDTVKGITGRLVIGKSDGANNFCMRFFELSEGGYSPKHAHEWEHEIIIHSGKGEVLSQDKWIPVTKGHVIFIPGNEEHQIRNASQHSLVFACLIPAGPPEL